VEGVTVIGESVTLGDEIYVNGGLVLPHKTVKTSIAHPKIIM
jgi:mannose-1-phosphate guanylyltransferase